MRAEGRNRAAGTRHHQDRVRRACGRINRELRGLDAYLDGRDCEPSATRRAPPLRAQPPARRRLLADTESALAWQQQKHMASVERFFRDGAGNHVVPWLKHRGSDKAETGSLPNRTSCLPATMSSASRPVVIHATLGPGRDPRDREDLNQPGHAPGLG